MRPELRIAADLYGFSTGAGRLAGKPLSLQELSSYPDICLDSPRRERRKQQFRLRSRPGAVVNCHTALRRVVSEGCGGFSHGSANFIAQGRIGHSPRECHTTRQERQERNRLVTASARTAFQAAGDALQDLSEDFFEEGASVVVSS
jgi:hypothetical protein